jgi:hypothetical protein
MYNSAASFYAFQNVFDKLQMFLNMQFFVNVNSFWVLGVVILHCNAMCTCMYITTFRWNILPPSSGLLENFFTQPTAPIIFVQRIIFICKTTKIYTYFWIILKSVKVWTECRLFKERVLGLRLFMQTSQMWKHWDLLASFQRTVKSPQMFSGTTKLYSLSMFILATNL